MTLQEAIQQAELLTPDERKELIKAVLDMLSPPKKHKRSLREMRGLAAHLYDGTDAQAHISAIRDEWVLH